MAAVSSHILLVDDNAELRAVYREALARTHRVRVAGNGTEAWESIQKDPPDLLVCDAEMPGMGGRMLCRRMEDHEGIPSMPTFLLGEDLSEERDADDVADEVLAKPVSGAELRQRVNRFLPSRELPEEVDAGGGFLKKAVRIVGRQLHDPNFTVVDLAERMDLSRRHLTRRLKETADLTPAELIRTRRIERAKVGLENDPSTIAEVQEAVGFRSASHFSQIFRDQVGCSPSTYREKHKS